MVSALRGAGVSEAGWAKAFGVWDVGSWAGRAAQAVSGGLPSGSAQNVRVSARETGVSARPVQATQRRACLAATVPAPLTPCGRDCSSAGGEARRCGGDERGAVDVCGVILGS